MILIEDLNKFTVIRMDLKEYIPVTPQDAVFSIQLGDLNKASLEGNS